MSPQSGSEESESPMPTLPKEEFDVYAFWVLDEMNDEYSTLSGMINAVKAMLSRFGPIRGIRSYGNDMIEFQNFQVEISQCRASLRKMVGATRAPPEGRRMSSLFQDRQNEEYEPDLSTSESDCDFLFNDPSWQEIVLVADTALRCHICGRMRFRSVKEVAYHMKKFHLGQLQEKFREQYPDRPTENLWWNNMAKVQEWVHASIAIGLRPGRLRTQQVQHYLMKLGFTFGKVRPAKREVLSSRVLLDSTIALRRWSSKESTRQPLIALIIEERVSLLKGCERLKGRYPGMKFVVIMKEARRNRFQYADWNFDWDEVMQGNFEPLRFEKSATRRQGRRWLSASRLRARRGIQRAQLDTPPLQNVKHRAGL